MALTITSRGTGTHNTGATTLVPGGRSATLAVGSLGVLCIALDNAGTSGSSLIAPDSWTDAKGNIWTLRQNALYDNGAASAGIEMAIYTAPITVALLTTDAGTMTWKASKSPVAKAWTWYEVIPSNGITPAFLNSGDIAGATAANAQVITGESINVGDGVIAGYFSENVAAVTQDSDSTNGSWTAQQTATVGTTTAGVRIATQQKVQTTAASTQSYDVTVNSQDRIAGYISVREVVAQTPAPTAASLTTSGATPTVTASDNKAVAPTAASTTTTGATPTVTVTANQLAEPTAAALTTTGATPDISTPVATAPTAASLTASLATPDVVTPTQVSPAAAELTLSLDTPAVSTPVVVDPDAGALVTTGEAPAISLPIQSTPDPGALSIALATPDVAVGADVDVQPDAASLTASGATPTVTATANIRVLPTLASLALAGTAPTVAVTEVINVAPAPAILALHGARPLVIVSGAEMAAYIAGLIAERENPWRPVHAAPSSGRAGIKGSAPIVRVGDDADIFAMLELIA